MSTGIKQAIERTIVKATIKALLDAGYKISVDNGEEFTLTNSISARKILSAMFTMAEDNLFTDKGHCVHFVYFNGNDGIDVICDYSGELEETLAPVFALVDRIEAGAIEIV